jgi:hypothetical protein
MATSTPAQKAFNSIKASIRAIEKARGTAAIVDLLAYVSPDNLYALKGVVDAGLEKSKIRVEEEKQATLNEQRRIDEEDAALLELLSQQSSYRGLRKSELALIVSNMRKESAKISNTPKRSKKTAKPEQNAENSDIDPSAFIEPENNKINTDDNLGGNSINIGNNTQNNRY